MVDKSKFLGGLNEYTGIRIINGGSGSFIYTNGGNINVILIKEKYFKVLMYEISDLI